MSCCSNKTELIFFKLFCFCKTITQYSYYKKIKFVSCRVIIFSLFLFFFISLFLPFLLFLSSFFRHPYTSALYLESVQFTIVSGTDQNFYFITQEKSKEKKKHNHFDYLHPKKCHFFLSFLLCQHVDLNALKTKFKSMKEIKQQ